MPWDLRGMWNFLVGEIKCITIIHLQNSLALGKNPQLQGQYRKGMVFPSTIWFSLCLKIFLISRELLFSLNSRTMWWWCFYVLSIQKSCSLPDPLNLFWGRRNNTGKYYKFMRKFFRLILTAHWNCILCTFIITFLKVIIAVSFNISVPIYCFSFLDLPIIVEGR